MTCTHNVDPSSTAYFPDGSVGCARCVRAAWAERIPRPAPAEPVDHSSRVVAYLDRVRPAKEAS